MLPLASRGAIQKYMADSHIKTSKSPAFPGHNFQNYQYDYCLILSLRDALELVLDLAYWRVSVLSCCSAECPQRSSCNITYTMYQHGFFSYSMSWDTLYYMQFYKTTLLMHMVDHSVGNGINELSLGNDYICTNG